MDARLGWCLAVLNYSHSPASGGWGRTRMSGEMTLSPSVLCPDPLHAHSCNEHLSADEKHRHLLLTTGAVVEMPLECILSVSCGHHSL